MEQHNHVTPPVVRLDLSDALIRAPAVTDDSHRHAQQTRPCEVCLHMAQLKGLAWLTKRCCMHGSGWPQALRSYHAKEILSLVAAQGLRMCAASKWVPYVQHHSS